jgi:hypothetical protein
MLTFCNDIHLLHWEPNILRDAAFASQTLIGGTGNLAGSTFTIAAGSFLAAHVAQDQVIVLTGGTAGSYPIVAIDSATQLTLSVLYDGLFPTGGDPMPSPPGTANDLTYAIRTFWPQRRIVSELLLQAGGIDPSDPDIEQKILNPHALERACTLGTLHMIHSALAAAAENPDNLNDRARLYEGLYRRALRSATLKLDLNLDGRLDTLRRLNVMDLERV